MDNELRRIRSIASYQFGNSAGEILFPEGVDITYSPNTGRIRQITYLGNPLANFRPSDGRFTLTINGAERLIKRSSNFEYFVMVKDDVSKFPTQGSDVFPRHVIDAGERIRPWDEVIVVNSNKEILAVGRSTMNKNEMKAFSKGVAVKVRHGKTKHT
jgi:predicted RNA-binding protein (TIGR00451 family)